MFVLAGLALFLSAAEGKAQTVRAPNAVITTNPYAGTPVSEFDARVSPYSSYGALNRYTTDGGRIYAQDGTYLGRLNSNRYDSESVANPYGRYGSRYSSTSINNPYSTYGSPYSSQSATNPYTSTPPVVRYTQPSNSYYTVPVRTQPSYIYTPPCYYNCK
jgi:hypothetical protein